jgi:polyphosphate kinase 2 (PPK2 family)
MAPLFSIARKRKICRFNRTHYENVLVTRVHPEYILNENLPGLEDVSLITDALWEKMGQIRNFEKHYRKWNYCAEILLHISKEEQRERLLRRLEEKTQLEVLSGDLKERERWDDYMQYYEEVTILLQTTPLGM